MRDIAARVVADRRWEVLPHDAERRVYERLWADERIEVWAIAWMPGHDTGFHDHDESAGAFCVAEGELVEERLTLGGTPLRRRIGPGDTVEFGPSHVHRVRNAGAERAVSVHVYSPPLRRMGAYEIDGDGVLVRRSLEAGAELRAEEPAAAG
jgi:mannose-6-phosphate isomerase-like protein (cupin superfamily)